MTNFPTKTLLFIQVVATVFTLVGTYVNLHRYYGTATTVKDVIVQTQTTY
jgi:hypothetical protein